MSLAAPAIQPDQLAMVDRAASYAAFPGIEL